MKYYGLILDDVLVNIKPFEEEPSLWDFTNVVSNKHTYKIVEVSVEIGIALSEEEERINNV
jgi:hypothetical protein